MSITPFPKRYTREEAAQILGISVSTLEREMRACRISAYRPGRRKVYFLQHQLDAYIEKVSTPWADEGSNQNELATTGSIGSPDLRSITASGTTPNGDKRDARASALTLLRLPARP